MSDYRRAFNPGGVYFFTVVTYQRRPIFSVQENVELLREAFHHVRASRPFTVDGIVVLPDHLHCIWRLPEGDADFSGRWREIKKYVSKRIGGEGCRTREKDVWQRRFWEHGIRNEDDWRRHIDYIHYNPVRHGLTLTPAQWPYSSFHKSVTKGWYPENWGGTDEPETIRGMDLE
ncbi:MAG: REP-associated tyrosine transposase [Gammaproteobacteria bacterium]